MNAGAELVRLSTGSRSSFDPGTHVVSCTRTQLGFQKCNGIGRYLKSEGNARTWKAEGCEHTREAVDVLTETAIW